MFAIAKVLRLRALVVAGLIAITSLPASRMANAQASTTNQWAWMGGTVAPQPNGTTNYWPSVYGTLGIPAAGNSPGCRYAAASWTDSGGNFWLFGGYGCDASGTSGHIK